MWRRALHTARAAQHFAKRGEQRAVRRAEAMGLPDPQEGAPRVVHGMRRNCKTSPWKLNLLAKQIRGLKVDEAIAQMAFSKKKVPPPGLRPAPPPRLKPRRRRARFRRC